MTSAASSPRSASTSTTKLPGWTPGPRPWSVWVGWWRWARRPVPTIGPPKPPWTRGQPPEDVVGTLISVAPISGLGRVISATPEVAVSLDYDLDVAFEGAQRGLARVTFLHGNRSMRRVGTGGGRSCTVRPTPIDLYRRGWPAETCDTEPHPKRVMSASRSGETIPSTVISVCRRGRPQEPTGVRGTPAAAATASPRDSRLVRNHEVIGVMFTGLVPVAAVDGIRLKPTRRHRGAVGPDRHSRARVPGLLTGFASSATGPKAHAHADRPSHAGQEH